MISHRTIRALVFVVGILGSLSASTSPAQEKFRYYKDYDRYRYLPHLPSGDEKPKPLPESKTEVKGDPKVLVEELKAIVFVDHKDKLVKAAEIKDVRGVQFGTTSPLPMLRTAAYQQIANSYIGKPVSVLRLNELVRDTVLYYRKCDQPVVDVTVPEQDVTDGVVQIIVTEARIGKVTVCDSCYFDNQVLADQLFLNSGCPIYESVLNKELQWLYRNPYRSVDLELTPGKAQGTTDLVFHVKDKYPGRVYGGYEDTGTQSTGRERLFAGVNLFDAFNEDDYFGYQYTTHPDFDRFQAHSTFYSLALQNRDIVTVYGSYAEYKANIPGFGVDPGSTWQILSRWNREFEPICEYHHGIQAGFDFKEVDGRLDFGPGVAFGSKYDVAQLMAGYNGREIDEIGSYSFGIDGYFSPGGFNGKNTDARFEAARAGAEADYIYGRGFFERRFNTPMESEIACRLTGQWAEGNLVPTEQLGLGGYNSIRGYNDYSVLGDSGYFVNVEWWTPTIETCCHNKPGQLRGLAFYDYGNALNHSLLPGESSVVDLQSVGVGARYKVATNLEFRFDYGYQLTRVPGITYNQRVHIGLEMSY